MNRRHFLKVGFGVGGTMVLADKAWALKYYPMSSDKKCAVLYSTWCGSARDAAVWISEGMGGIADVFDVRENPDLKGFEHIVIGGSIRSMATSEQLQKFIRDNKAWLKEKVRGLFAVCGDIRNPVGQQQTTQYIDNRSPAKLCEVTSVPSRVFLGRITKSLMDPRSAGMMAASWKITTTSNDTECMAFGQEVLTKLKAHPSNV